MRVKFEWIVFYNTDFNPNHFPYIHLYKIAQLVYIFLRNISKNLYNLDASEYQRQDFIKNELLNKKIFFHLIHCDYHYPNNIV